MKVGDIVTVQEIEYNGYVYNYDFYALKVYYSNTHILYWSTITKKIDCIVERTFTL